MTAKEAIEKIKQLFEIQNPPAAPAVKLADVTTKDGQPMTIEGDIAVGSKCSMKDASGALTPCPDGEYELSDGTKIKCAGGLITDVAPATPAAPPAMPEMESRMSAVENALKALTDSKFTEENQKLNEKISALETQLAEMKAANEKFSATVKEGFALVEKIAEQPAASPVTPVKNKFGIDKDKKEERILGMLKVISELKQNAN